MRTDRVQASGMVAAERRDAHAELGLGGGAASDEDPVARRQGRRARIPARDPVSAPEGTLDEPDRLRVRDVAGDRDDRVRGPVAGRPELADPRRHEPADVRLLPADLPAERPPPEHRLLEEDLAVLGRVVKVAPDLLDDHASFAIDVGLVEGRPADELAEDVDGAGGLAPRDPRPVDRGFSVRRRVERSTDALDRLAERSGRWIGLRALERQVLEEMGDAGLALGLDARAGEDVGGDGDRPRIAEPGADHPGPVGQRRPFEHRRDGTRSSGVGRASLGIERPAPTGAGRRAEPCERSSDGDECRQPVAGRRRRGRRSRPPT